MKFVLLQLFVAGAVFLRTCHSYLPPGTMALQGGRHFSLSNHHIDGWLFEDFYRRLNRHDTYYYLAFKLTNNGGGDVGLSRGKSFMLLDNDEHHAADNVLVNRKDPNLELMSDTIILKPSATDSVYVSFKIDHFNKSDSLLTLVMTDLAGEAVGRLTFRRMKLKNGAEPIH